MYFNSITGKKLSSIKSHLPNQNQPTPAEKSTLFS